MAEGFSCLIEARSFEEILRETTSFSSEGLTSGPSLGRSVLRLVSLVTTVLQRAPRPVETGRPEAILLPIEFASEGFRSSNSASDPLEGMRSRKAVFGRYVSERRMFVSKVQREFKLVAKNLLVRLICSRLIP